MGALTGGQAVQQVKAGIQAGRPNSREGRQEPWKKNLDATTIASFQRELSAMGYKHQFITLAGIHNMWHGMFSLAHDYARHDMTPI